MKTMLNTQYVKSSTVMNFDAIWLKMCQEDKLSLAYGANYNLHGKIQIKTSISRCIVP
jgi:hypothetical protein